MILRKGKVKREQREWDPPCQGRCATTVISCWSFRFRWSTSHGLGSHAVLTKNANAIRAGQTSYADNHDDRILFYPTVQSHDFSVVVCHPHLMSFLDPSLTNCDAF
jgi:hypothetical protein